MGSAEDSETRARSLEREVARLARIERRMEQLLAVTGALAGARELAEVARIVIERGFDAVGASYGGIWLVEPGTRTLKLLSVSTIPRGTIDRWNTIPLDLDAPLPQVARTGEPIFLASLAEFETRFPASLARIREIISSPNPAYANLPLLANGVPIGGIAVTYDRAEELDASERTVLTILASQCGQAIGRLRAEAELAHAYGDEQAAHHLAEEATRAREEILSVVSHDLRNPLNTILMGASTLLQLADPHDPKSQRIRVVAERINRQSERMARLIEDLVDFAALQAGAVTITAKPCTAEAIIAQAAAVFAPIAEERGVGFEAHTDPDLPPFACDPDRAVQVLSNLLSNALKVTPKGGRIAIGARGDRDGVVFFVRDTGAGFEADELPRLFERYWRSKKTTHRGAGLGLSIAKGIVDAHGGRIWAESQVDTGSTFLFTLTPKP